MERNLFDHYHQLENHITSGLLSVLDANPGLVEKIFRSFGVRVPKSKLHVLSQRMPVRSPNKDSILDGTIFSKDHKFCIGIENKIATGTIKKPQIDCHLSKLRVFDEYLLWIISPDDQLPSSIQGDHILHTPWAQLCNRLIDYKLATKNLFGQKLLSEFILYLDRMPQMSDFTGLHFDHGYDVDLAKIYVKKLKPILYDRMVELFPGCHNTRTTISGLPWDAWFSSRQPQESVHPGYA